MPKRSSTTNRSRAMVQVLLSAILCLCALQAAAQDVTVLKLDQGVNGEFANSSDKHRYQINLSSGQYAAVTVEQRGVDLAARLIGADGSVLAEIDDSHTTQGEEAVEIVANADTKYQIEIVPALPKVFAGRYLVRLSTMHAASANEKALDEARLQYYRSQMLFETGNFDTALDLANSALRTREKLLPLDHRDILLSVLMVSKCSLVKNDISNAESSARRAMELAGARPGKESLIYAEAVTSLGRVRTAQAGHAEAEKLYLQALAIRERSAGLQSLAVAASLHNLAVVYRALSDNARAEQHFSRSLAIHEKLLGDEHLETALVLNNFGLYHYGAGDLEKAASLMTRSLAIKEKVLPQVHRQIGIALNNLGLIAWKGRSYEKAKEYYLRAISIFEITSGAESVDVGNILHNLGIIIKESDGDFRKAEEYYKRSLAIFEKYYGENHQLTANGASSLAILYRVEGDLENAERYQSRAYAIQQQVLGPYHLNSLLSLGNLMRIAAAKGDVERAVTYADRLTTIHEKIIPLNLRIGSERQKISYYKQTERFDGVVTLHTRVAPNLPRMRDMAATAILRHKGRILDAVAENLSALRERFRPEDQKLLDDLADVNSRLAKLILASRQKVTAEEQQQIAALEAKREGLESEIGRRSLGSYEPSRPVTLDDVRAAVPAGAALVEFAVYRPANWNADRRTPDYGDPRYVVYVITRDGETKWQDLGDAKPIEAAVDRLRTALRDPKRSDVRGLARALDALVMRPVRAMVGEASHLLISPDGELNLIPFEALVDESDRYLVEEYSISYLTSGRDLLRMQTPRAPGQDRPLIVADPLFGDAAEKPKSGDERTGRRGSVTTSRNLADTWFAPLGGTMREARSILALFPDAALLTGAGATETALRSVTAPRILHIATHGFFLDNSDPPESDPTVRTAGPTTATQNPLFRSGVALAGANRHDNSKDDGIVTAFEASGLNLWGTKLVVLSACDTGLGEVRNGQGVYGLRRAFVLAGTESLVMSLWAISDSSTRELMAAYYKNLKQGMGRGAALRQVQLEMIKRKERAHPFYWASFIQSGEWASLDGKRQTM